MMLHAPLGMLAGLFALSLVTAGPEVAAVEHQGPQTVVLTFAALR